MSCVAADAEWSDCCHPTHGCENTHACGALCKTHTYSDNHPVFPHWVFFLISAFLFPSCVLLPNFGSSAANRADKHDMPFLFPALTILLCLGWTCSRIRRRMLQRGGLEVDVGARGLLKADMKEKSWNPLVLAKDACRRASKSVFCLLKT